jgi:hypothetical protein
MRIRWTWPVTLAALLNAGLARADVPLPGAWGCTTASAGDACQMDLNGQPTGVWGICIQSKCGGWVVCTDPAAAAAVECADGAASIRPGYGQVYRDCLLCNPEAGTPSTGGTSSSSTGGDSADSAGGPAAGGSPPATPTLPNHDTSGCAFAPPGPASWAWLCGAATALLLVRQRRRRSSDHSATD